MLPLNHRLRPFYVLVLAATLGACGGGGGGDGDSPELEAPSTLSVTGTVSAPGGTVAFNPPTGLSRMFASLFGSPVNAAVSDTTVVAGATVSLYALNDDGSLSGSAIATAVTGSDGTYTLTVPDTVTPSASYAVVVTGSAGTMTALATSTTVDVDPATDATMDAIIAAVDTANSTMSAVSAEEVTEVQAVVDSAANDVEATSLTDSASYSAALLSEAQNSDETKNIVSSAVSSGVITGTVTGPGGTALSNITIVVRDFGDWVTRAKTRTDANGVYTVNVPTGDYIIGALNHTGTSTAASEWYTDDDAGSAVQFGASKVTVGGSTVTKNFSLVAGGRISGTVTAETGGATLGGIVIVVRNASNDMPVALVRTKQDGSFRVNVRDGSYILIARNPTRQAYASESFSATGNGSVTTSGADIIDVAVDDTLTRDFSLQSGYNIRGIVSDPTTGVIGGMPVRFYDDTGAFIDGMRTNADGKYRLWLRDGATYTVRSRGQSADVALSGASQIQSFAAAVGAITATIKDASNNPVSQAKVDVYEASSGNFEYIGFESSNGDGTVTIYSDNVVGSASAVTSLDHAVAVKMDNGTNVGSSVYNGQTRLTVGYTAVTFTLDATNAIDGGMTAFPNVALPAGSILSGTIYQADGTTPRANAIVQVRDGGTTGAFRFVNTRTQSDGSYTISLPSSMVVDRVCAYVSGTATPCNSASSGTGFNSQDGVNMSTDQTVNLTITP